MSISEERAFRMLFSLERSRFNDIVTIISAFIHTQCIIKSIYNDTWYVLTQLRFSMQKMLGYIVLVSLTARAQATHTHTHLFHLILGRRLPEREAGLDQSNQSRRLGH